MSEGGWVRRKRRSRIPVRQPTGLYVHSSPPTVVPVHPSIVRQWLRGGEINRLQEIILKGQGASLVGEYSPDSKARAFINALPRILKKIDELHAAARIGNIESVDAILKSEPRINLELSRDSSGTGLLHKAVIHGHVPLQEWLLKNYPKTVEVLDKEKRNPLHYAGGNEEVWNRLVAGGADTSTVDREGYSPAFYMNHPRRLRPPAPESRRVIPQASQGIVVKPSNIRIWIHDKDLGRLQKVLWEGMGDKLKTETSSQPLVRRFLNAVPYILGSIRDVHTAAVNNDVELLKSKSSDPVPKDILLSKDSSGLNPLHKAAGLGHMEVARAILDRAPEAVNSKDNLDRTPLHYAAALKDQNQMYQLLVESNATDHLEDKKGNTPSHYRARPQDLDGPKLLNVVPDAPRTAHIFPPSWDWRLLNDDATSNTPLTSPQVEAPPAIPDAKEPEDPKKQVEEKQFDDKPPEIEPSPEEPPEENPEEPHEEENQVEQEESKDATDPPGISDDEGVGSEANPSIENTSTPLSDTVNEEEEISGARLGETMTLTTSLFSSKAPRTEESVNGTDSGNEDGDQAENRMINVENGEVESSQVETPGPLINNSLETSENNHDVNIDYEIEGIVNEEDDQQYDSGNPGNISLEVTDEQLLASEAPQYDKGEPEPDSNEQPLPETDRSTTNILSEQEGNALDEGIIRDEETEMLEKNVNNAGEQTHNQNNLLNSENINMQAEGSAKNEEKESVNGGEPRESNQNLGSTQDLNATFTKISSHGVNEAEKEDENDTAVNITEGTPLTQNQYSESEPFIGSTSHQGDMIGEGMRVSSEDSSNVVEVTHDSEGADVDQNQNNVQTNETAPTENEFALNGRPSTRSGAGSASASGSRPPSRRSGVGTPSSRPGTSTDKPNQGEIGDTNLDNNESNSLGDQLGGDNESGLEDDKGYGISNEPEDGSDFGQTFSCELEPIEAEGGAAILGSQTELQKNVEVGSQESIVAIPKEDDDQGEENPPEDGKAESNPVQARYGPAEDESSDLMDLPITTRSAGGSRAEILAITPAPPDEEDAMDADDQKAVEATAEEDRATAEALVAAGDMESMAEMVLNGRGSGLLNMTSTNPDVQLFINNIPQYIAKIERVHVAAREGDLRGVQTALDRRKFAVARDNSTPLKPTPLHVAALFGRTSVLRYLAGRFPETMHAQDVGGRTALHYAATLPDNGHFYSLLVTLGADKSVIDNEGRTAEYYLRNRGELSREELLSEYQNRPVPVDTSGLNFNRFSDKVENDQVSSRKDVDDQVLLTKLDACLRLIRMRAPRSLLSRVLQDDVYQEMKSRSTRLDNSLLDLITPGVRDIALGKGRLLQDKLFTGLSVPDYESYKVFEEILLPAIREINGIGENDDTPVQPPPDFYGSENKDYFLKLNLDPSGMILKSFTVEVSRNLSVAALPQNLKLSDLEKTEVAVSAYLTVFYKNNKDNTFIDESGENFGAYYSLNEVVENKEVFSDLQEEELIADGIDEPIAENWPYGRGVFISPYGDITAWINIRDHLKLFSITSTEKSGAVGEAYYTIFQIITLIEEKLEVKTDTKLGYLTSDPALVGNALRFKALLNLPHLSQDRIGLRKLCKEQRLILKPSHRTSQFRVFSTFCLGITEIESFKKYVESLNILIETERNQMKGTILQIPNLIKTFLHKKPK